MISGKLVRCRHANFAFVTRVVRSENIFTEVFSRVTRMKHDASASHQTSHARKTGTIHLKIAPSAKCNLKSRLARNLI